MATTERIQLGRFELHSTNDLERFDQDTRNQIARALQVLYLRDSVRIDQCIVAVVSRVDSNRPSELDAIEALWTVLAYLCLTPQPPDDRLYLSLEHLTPVVCTPGRFDRALVRSAPTEPDEVIDGFEVIYNLRHYLWVDELSRVYPPTPTLHLDRRQDLSLIVNSLLSDRTELRELHRILDGPRSEFGQRALASLRWFNRSCSTDTDDEPALLSLAVALEALLGLPEQEKLSERLREAVLSILGRYPRLDDWLLQFYRARSSIVHTGRARTLRYLVGGPKKDGLSQEYHAFLAYGRVVFRLCVSALLFAATRSRAADMEERLVTNQERFQDICRILNDQKLPAVDRLASAKDKILAVGSNRNNFETGLKLDTILGATKALGRILALAVPETEPDVLVCAAALAEAPRSADQYVALEKLAALECSMRVAGWRGHQGDTPAGLAWLLIESAWHYLSLRFTFMKYSRK